MIEIAAAALSIAAQLLFRFLDGPDRRMQRQKLESEIEEFARQRQVTKLSDDQIRAIKDSVISEMHLLVDQTPGLKWKPSKIKKDGFTVQRDEAELEGTRKVMARLQLAVEARRKLIEGSAQLPADDPPEGWVSGPQPEASAPVNQHTGDKENQPIEDKSPNNERGQDWLQTQHPTEDAPERLSRLARRIEERRQ